MADRTKPAAWMQFRAEQAKLGVPAKEAGVLWRSRKQASDEKPSPYEAYGSGLLDRDKISARIVVTDQGAIYAQDERMWILPKTDPASRLPIGAKFRKTKDGKIIARQLNPSEDHPDLVTATVGEGIAQFNRHFHPDWKE